MREQDEHGVVTLTESETCIITAATLQTISHRGHLLLLGWLQERRTDCVASTRSQIWSVLGYEQTVCRLSLAKETGKMVLTSPSTFIYTVGTTLTKY